MGEFLISNWFLIIAAIAVGAVVGILIFKFFKLPTKEQLAKVKEWLLIAVAEAEAELGGGTGQLKLRWVYDKFLTKFPFLVKIVSFDTFSDLVDQALDIFRKMLVENDAVKDFVNK